MKSFSPQNNAAGRQRKLTAASQGGGDESSGESEEGGGRRPGMLERVSSMQHRQRLIAHSTALESITAEVDDAVMADLVDETDVTDNLLSTWGGIPAKNRKGDNLLIFIGKQEFSSVFFCFSTVVPKCSRGGRRTSQLIVIANRG